MYVNVLAPRIEGQWNAKACFTIKLIEFAAESAVVKQTPCQITT